MKVCVLGDVMLDVYRHITPTKLSQEAPVVVGLFDRNQYVPGGAANAAANCAALGAETVLVGYVGADTPAKWLGIALHNAEVQDRCVVLGDWTTICKERVVDAVTGHQFVRIDTEAPSPIHNTDDSEIIRGRLQELVGSCDCLLVSDYNKGTCEWVVTEAISLFKRHGKFVVVNGKPNHLSRYLGADVIAMNRGEWDVVRQGANPDQLAVYASPLLPGSTLIVTRGAEPLIVLRPGRGPEYYACRKVDVADVSGAGDTLVAVLAVRANVLRQTVEEAVKIATEVVQYKGTAVPRTRLIN